MAEPDVAEDDRRLARVPARVAGDEFAQVHVCPPTADRSGRLAGADPEYQIHLQLTRKSVGRRGVRA
jgi:hypothetical protein